MSTVRWLMKSSAAISRLVRPIETQAQDLELAAGQLDAVRFRRRAAAEALGDRLAECGHLARRRRGKRPRAELAGGPVSVAQPLQRLFALAGRGQHDPGAEFDLRPLEGDRERAVQLDRPREVLGGSGLVAVEHGHLADRLRQRRQCVAVAGLRGHLRQRLGAGVQVGAIALAGEERRRPADPPDRVVVVLALLPAGEQGAAVLGRLLLGPLGRGDVGEARGRVHEHVVVANRGGDRARGREHPARRGQLPLESVDRADQALGHPDRRAGVDQLATQLAGARPLAALAQHVDEAGDAGELGDDVLAGAAEAERGVQRFLGAAVVRGVVEDHAEALVELRRDRRQVVLEGEGKRAADRLQPASRTRRPWPARRPAARGRERRGRAGPPP